MSNKSYKKNTMNKFSTRLNVIELNTFEQSSSHKTLTSLLQSIITRVKMMLQVRLNHKPLV